MVSAPGKRQVLAADDDPDILYVLEELLVSSGYEVITAREGEEALSLALKEKPDIVILDVMMPGMSGLEVVSCLRKEKEFLTIPIILLTSRDQPDDIREGLLVGADDYINKPFRGRELLLRIETACRNRNYYSESIVKRTGGSSKEEVFGDLGIVGKSRAIKGIREQISSISGIDSTVLITGETGVGKEVVASAIHKSSRRRDKPFIVQNVAAVPEQLVESIFFGYKKGAFTGAVSDRQGLFSAANGGTIFLDEIGELSLSSQAVLLRVLESGTYVPVGSSREERVDVRVIAATCRDLKEEVRKGNFREDLYYRLNVINIHIPPLRERKEDIPSLVQHFIKELSLTSGLKVCDISSEVISLLTSWEWRGNVRELRNEVERMLIRAQEGEVILPIHLSEEIREGRVSREVQSFSKETLNLKEAVAALEMELIKKALEESRNNKSKAALLLGISRSNLISKIKQYGL